MFLKYHINMTLESRVTIETKNDPNSPCLRYEEKSPSQIQRLISFNSSDQMSPILTLEFMKKRSLIFLKS